MEEINIHLNNSISRMCQILFARRRMTTSSYRFPKWWFFRLKISRHHESTLPGTRRPKTPWFPRMAAPRNHPFPETKTSQDVPFVTIHFWVISIYLTGFSITNHPFWETPMKPPTAEGPIHCRRSVPKPWQATSGSVRPWSASKDMGIWGL